MTIRVRNPSKRSGEFFFRSGSVSAKAAHGFERLLLRPILTVFQSTRITLSGITSAWWEWWESPWPRGSNGSVGRPRVGRSLEIPAPSPGEAVRSLASHAWLPVRPPRHKRRPLRTRHPDQPWDRPLPDWLLRALWSILRPLPRPELVAPEIPISFLAAF